MAEDDDAPTGAAGDDPEGRPGATPEEVPRAPDEPPPAEDWRSFPAPGAPPAPTAASGWAPPGGFPSPPGSSSATLDVSPTGDAAAGPPRRSGSRWRAAALVGAVVVLIAGLGAAAYLLFVDDSSYPDEWDPRVADLVAFVEDERDLLFDHPVHVDFLDAAEYSERTTTDEADLSEEDRAEIESYAGAFRALGLVEGDFDLFEESNELADAGTLAYYSFEDERIVVRGTEVTPGLEVTLVHELTHALQDQHFDIGRLEDVETDGEALALRALIEGDAGRIEDAYYETLDAAVQAEIDEEQEGGDAPEIDVPDVLATFFGAPYFLGEGLIAALDASDGDDAIDRAFEDPPTTEEQLLDPFAYLDDDEALSVETPELPAGVKILDDGDFGALTWFLALAERLDPLEALRAVDGWGGDAYSLYTDGGRTCVAAAFVGDSEEDTVEMEASLGAWAAKMPEGAATAERDGEAAVLRSCDPGADAALGVTGASSDAIGIPLVRTALAVGTMHEGATADQARCFGHELIGAFPIEVLTDPVGAALQTPEAQQKILEMADRCR